MKTRDIVIGLIVLVILISGALLIRNSRKAKVINSPLPTPNFQKVESKFPNLTVPTNADRINLSGESGSGEAFKTYQNGKFNLTIMANLPEPKTGYFYQGWLVRGNKTDSNFASISLGKLALSKGGYLSEFSATKDYSDYKKIVVTQEHVFDNTPETQALEGSF